MFQQIPAFFIIRAYEKFEQCLKPGAVIFLIDHGDISGDPAFDGECLQDLHEKAVDG